MSSTSDGQLRCLINILTLEGDGEWVRRRALLDTGADVNCCSVSHPLAVNRTIEPSKTYIAGFDDGTPVKALGMFQANCRFGEDDQNGQWILFHLIADSAVGLILSFPSFIEANLLLDRNGVFNANGMQIAVDDFLESKLKGPSWNQVNAVISDINASILTKMTGHLRMVLSILYVRTQKSTYPGLSWTQTLTSN